MSEPLHISASLLNSRLVRYGTADAALVNGYLSGQVLTRGPSLRVSSAQAFKGRFTRPRYQRSPDRDKSRQRRSRLASTMPMPPNMCGMITEGQRAYAKIVRDEVQRTGDCRLTLDEIAARGGMSRKTAQRAQARLAELRWISVQHRPVRGRKHLSNVITIISKEWLTWIERGPKWPIGGQQCPTTVNQINITREVEQMERLQGAYEGKNVRGRAQREAMRGLQGG